jgi:hypothetical protein
MRPTFIVIGAMKAGTTSLYEYVRSHPEVFMATPKEPDFFDDRLGNWHRGLRWYESLFDGADGAKAVGEASPGYTRYPTVQGVPARMASVVPEARLVYVVRDPVERMRSQYQQNVLYEGEQEPIDDALLGNPHYLDCSRYAMQIDQFLEHYAEEQLLVVTSEALRDERAATLAKVFAFIGVDASWIPPNLAVEAHRSTATRARGRVGRLARRAPGHELVTRLLPEPVMRAYRSAVSRPVAADAFRVGDDTRRRLEERLRPDVARLRRYLGPDFDGWGLV